MKRYIYIIIGIVVLAVIAILVILFFKSKMNNAGNPSGAAGTLPVTGTQTPGTGTTGTTGGASSSTGTGTGATGQNGAGSFNMFFAGPVLDYFADAQNNITAVETDGTVVSVVNGQVTTLSSTTIDNIISAQFSSDGEKIFVSFGSPNNPQSGVFNVPTQSWIMLSPGIESPSWLPSTYQVAYFTGTSSGVVTLWTLNLATSTNQPRSILTLNAQDLGLDWINKNQMIFYDKPSIQTADSIWIFTISTKSLIPAIYEQAGVEAIWNDNTTSTSTPEGLIFVGGSSGQASTLKLVNLSGDILQNLNFGTLPTKCLFNEEGQATSTSATSTSTASSTPDLSYTLMLYCGIPRDSSIFSGNQLPDAYNQLALFTSDDIYKINTATGEKDVLWNDQTQSMDVSDPKIFNDTFFFVNRENLSLYGLSLGE